VLGGGVLGLEAACGLARRGLAVTVVHLDAHLMADQLDADPGHVLADSLSTLGIRVLTGTSVAEVVGAYGELVAVRLTDGSVLATDLLLVSCGVRPDVALARDAGLPTGRGVSVTDDLASPADARVHAIGDCADTPGAGLVAPGWRQAERLAARLTRSVATPVTSEPGDGLPEGVRLKAHGLDLTTRGLRGGTATSEDRVVALTDPRGGRHVEVVVRGDRLVGYTALGAGRVGAELAVAFERRTPLPLDPAALLLPQSGPAEPRTAAESPTLIPADATICRCNGVTKAEIVEAWEDGAHDVAAVASTTRATTGCGGCRDTVCGLVDWLTASDGPGESAAQPVRNTTVPSVAATKHRDPTGEMQRS
jgi:assimilatory nitrate reductase electron transfer subunit